MSKSWADDLALAQGIAAGDDARLTALVRRLHGPLRRVAQAWLGPGAGAEDLVQETWEAVIDHVSDYEGRASLRTWITRILVNRAKTRLARAKPHIDIAEAELAGELPGTSFGTLGLWAGQPSYATGPEEALVRQRAREWLGGALEALPPAQRAVVTLRDVEEWTSEEVCNALGLSESNQRVLLHRGRAKLRAALQATLDRERTACR
jgi:RNA polymerase sigma-70 factor, ECF subfamily